jgi:hypoxanthine phosphoribosyltransferase
MLYNLINILYLFQGTSHFFRFTLKYLQQYAAPKGKIMNNIQKILFDELVIERKVAELGSQISKDYAGKELILVCILKGACIFTADLMRRLTIPVNIEFIQVESYGACKTSSENVIIKQYLELDIKGKHVLLIDTIIDTGTTLACMLKKFSEQVPASLGTIALLDKKALRRTEVVINYSGFEISDEFVVGYGMDCAGNYRNLPYIAVLDTSDRC